MVLLGVPLFLWLLTEGGLMAALLEASGVEVTIAGTEILRGADLALEPGELVAVVGPNGAGKSTFARAFCGLRRPEGGHA